jgi:predicted metal-dependent HD superfamily phosphohydrolase
LDVEAIKQAARNLYSSDLPYHNFGHALAVLREAEEIVGRCRAEGVPVDGDVVRIAALFHDAGFHEDHAGLGFPSKEAYSAELARRELRCRDIAPDVIDRVCEAILSTHHDGICRNNESKAVRAADLAGLAADYAVFKRNSLRLKREHELLSRTRVSWLDWRRLAAARCELFLRQELDLTRDYFDAEGRSVFHRRTRENLRQLESDPDEQVKEGGEIACL